MSHFPELFERMPEVDAAFHGIRMRLLRGPTASAIFVEARTAAIVPDHSHGAQWGIVVDGEMELTIGGTTRTYRKGDEYTTYRVRPGGTVLMPFIPNREMYEDPADYDADVAHTGENTSIMFATRDLVELQDELMARGVRFSRKAQMEEWGGMHAKFLDPDDNVYSVIEPRPKAR